MNNDEKNLIEKETITNKIYTIRGVQVMLDSDLAELYGYETKNFNRQAKNNALKFEGEDFMFQLNDEETENLSRCKNFTMNKSNGRGSNIKYKPYVFTEQGIYMLMTVLKGDLAIKQSRALVRTFKEMRHYINNNHNLFTNNELLKLNNEVTEINKRLDSTLTKNEFNEAMKEFIGPNKKKNIYF